MSLVSDLHRRQRSFFLPPCCLCCLVSQSTYICVCVCLPFVFQYVACFCCTGLAFPPIILDSRALLEVCLTVWAVWHRAVPQRERAYIMAWYNYGMARYIWHCMRAQMWRSIHILSRTDQDHDSSPSRGCTHGRAHYRARQALATATAQPAPSPGVTACAHAHVIVVPILSRTAVSRAGTDQCTRTWLTCAQANLLTRTCTKRSSCAQEA